MARAASSLSVKPRAARMRGNDLVSACGRVVTDSRTPASPDNSIGRHAIREAMRLADVSQKVMAQSADVPESNLSHALSGNRSFDIDWLLAQDDAFLVAWMDFVDAARGLTPQSRASIRAARIGELVQLLTEGVA